MHLKSSPHIATFATLTILCARMIASSTHSKNGLCDETTPTPNRRRSVRVYSVRKPSSPVLVNSPTTDTTTLHKLLDK